MSEKDEECARTWQGQRRHEGMKRILVPLDFSDVTAEVIELARLLAQSPQSSSG